jgi:hypothetical protein
MRFLLACLTIIFFLPIEAASAVQCRTSRSSDATQYRIIDGRRCWYQGERRLAKTKLHWAASRPTNPGRSDAGGGSARRTTQAPVAPPPPFLADIERAPIIWFDTRPATAWPEPFSERFPEAEGAFAFAPAALEENGAARVANAFISRGSMLEEMPFPIWWIGTWAAFCAPLLLLRRRRWSAAHDAYLATRLAPA